ncbi:hypothetical protein Agau_P200489 (plasmid) [Agrobacterium tumefaciens F2]|nr:hypothetical protein Agau_P200489 [Agrobacterium tumefaciens F2]
MGRAQFRRVDIRDPDFLALKPERISVDHAAHASPFSANREGGRQAV